MLAKFIWGGISWRRQLWLCAIWKGETAVGLAYYGSGDREPDGHPAQHVQPSGAGDCRAGGRQPAGDEQRPVLPVQRPCFGVAQHRSGQRQRHCDQRRPKGERDALPALWRLPQRRPQRHHRPGFYRAEGEYGAGAAVLQCAFLRAGPGPLPERRLDSAQPHQPAIPEQVQLYPKFTPQSDRPLGPSGL